jgi:hypothetical protein
VAHVTWTAHVSWLLPLSCCRAGRRREASSTSGGTDEDDVAAQLERSGAAGGPARGSRRTAGRPQQGLGDQNRPGGDGAGFRIDTNNLIAGGPSGYDIDVAAQLMLNNLLSHP